MFTRKITKHENPPGEVTTRHVEGNIVETVYRGACTEALVRSVADLTPEVMDSVPGANWLLDLSQVKSTEASARKPGSDIFRIFRERGGGQFAVLATAPSLRMLLIAVGFAAGLPFKTFEHREEALAYLRSLPAKPR